jgi:hypothetical protein
VLDEFMDFWTLLVIALALLWAQANVISCAGLHALRAAARARWEALVSLEKCLFACLAANGEASPEELGRWGAVLEKTILPESASGVLEFYEHMRRGTLCVAATGFPVLELRCRQAARCYAEAAALYNSRISFPMAWPLSKWMGFVPVQPPPGEGAFRNVVSTGQH